SSPDVTLSRGGFSAPSLATPTRGLLPGLAWFPFATVIRDRSLPPPPHTALGHARRFPSLSCPLRSPPMTAPTARHPPASPPPGAPQAQAQAHRQAYHRRKTRAEAQREARQQREAAHVEALPVQHPHAAGIDIGSRSHWVCVGFTTEAASCLIQ